MADSHDYSGYQLLDPHRPARTVEATTEQDVRDAVGFAATHGLRIAVQATGHGRSRALDGGVLIATRQMCGVQVDPVARTAWVEAGATWQHVIAAAGPHGLAPLSGSAPGVGAVSYTLGGGVGQLARRYGFAADHVRRIDLVTVDGLLHRARPMQVSAAASGAEDELFRVLRGRGANLGVVTGMEIDLMPVTQVFGGSLHVDVAQVPDVLDRWRRWTASVPDETTSAVAMLPYPDLPVIRPELRGRHVAQIQVVHAGPAAEGAELVAPLREALGPVLRHTLRELPYTESGTVFDEPDQPHGYRGTSLLLRPGDRAGGRRAGRARGRPGPVRGSRDRTLAQLQLRAVVARAGGRGVHRERPPAGRRDSEPTRPGRAAAHQPPGPLTEHDTARARRGTAPVRELSCTSAQS